MDIKNLKFKSDGDLVLPDITEECLPDALLLQEDYAAKSSETTAVLTYIYQSYIIEPFDKGISTALERIAIQEMHHHSALGNMIVALGGNPIIGARNRFWSGGYVNYSKNPTDMILLNIKAEEIAIADYYLTIARLKTESIKEVIHKIIADERAHIETFTEILKYINKQ